MQPANNSNRLVSLCVASHVCLIWLGYAGLHYNLGHTYLLVWLGFGILWLAWPIVVLSRFRRTGPVITLLASTVAWAPIAPTLATFLAWSTGEFAP
jgi:hypothetical protein